MIPWWGSHLPMAVSPTVAESLLEANRLLAVMAARTAIEISEVKALQKQVETTRDIAENIEALLQRFSGTNTDTVAIAALTRSLASSTDALAAAVAAKQ